MSTLKDEIYAKCTQEQIESRDCALIASIVNIGRTKPNNREIGNGTILETIGIAAGNNLLDVLMTDNNFRHVKPLLEQGRLIISSPLVATTLQTMVPAVLNQDQANKLIALGRESDFVTVSEVGNALYNVDGSIK